MAVFAAMVTRHSDCSCLCSILRPFLLIVNRLLAPAIVHPHRFPKSVFVGTAPMPERISRSDSFRFPVPVGLMMQARSRSPSMSRSASYAFWLCSYSSITELIVHPFNPSDRSRSARDAPCRIANHRPCTDVRASSLRKIPCPCRPRPDGTGLS